MRPLTVSVLRKVEIRLGVENGRAKSKSHIVFWMEYWNLNTVQEHFVYILVINKLTTTFHLAHPYVIRVNVSNHNVDILFHELEWRNVSQILNIPLILFLEQTFKKRHYVALKFWWHILSRRMAFIQWKLSKADTSGANIFVRCRQVSALDSLSLLDSDN